MNRGVLKSRIAVATLVLLALCATTACASNSVKQTESFTLADPAEPPVCASIEETADRLKVFVGDTVDAPVDYTQLRADFVTELAATDEGKKFEAIIGFDDYYTIDTVTKLAKEYGLSINRAYMWPKGETGRFGLYVGNGDIKSSLEAFKQRVEANGLCEDEQFAKDYQRLLDGEYEVFAMTVTATADKLEALNAADCTNYVDVKYNAEAEAYAAKVGKTVSYIELPTKPDGAL